MRERPKSRGVLKNWYSGPGFNYGFVTLTESAQPEIAGVGTEVFIYGDDRLDVGELAPLVDGKAIVEINGLNPPRPYTTERCPRDRSWRVFSHIAGCA